MSAHRIKIKRRREARNQAAQTRTSPITASDIFGSSAVSGAADHNDDDLDPEHIPTEEELDAQMEDILNDLESRKAAQGPLSASDKEHAQAMRQELLFRNMPSRFPNPFLKGTAPSLTGTPTPSLAKPPAASPFAFATASAAPATQPAPEAISDPAPTPPASGHSTGPRTQAGKDRSSQNAMKHGLTATGGAALVFLSSEEADAYIPLSAHFTQQFVPMTGAEREIVREIVDALSLARRARDLQASALQEGDDRALALYLRYETAHLRAHNAAIKTLLVLQKDRRQRNENHEKWNEPVHWGEFTFISDNDSYDAEPSQTPAAAATSASPAGPDTSFRSAGSKPWSEMSFGTPNAHPAASDEALEEVKPAA
jgi:hypothetical protein